MQHKDREDRRCLARDEEGCLAEWKIGDRLLVVYTQPPIRARIMTVEAEKHRDHTIYPLFGLGRTGLLDGSSGPYAFFKLKEEPHDANPDPRG